MSGLSACLCLKKVFVPGKAKKWIRMCEGEDILRRGCTDNLKIAESNRKRKNPISENLKQ